MTHRLNAFLLLLAALVGLPYYWLLLANPPRSAEPHPVTIGQLRQLASTLPGQEPTDIGVFHVGWKRVPANFYAAGSGMKRRQFAVLAWRLRVPGKGPVLIDSGTTRTLMGAMNGEGFLPRTQAALEHELSQASLTLATSELPQHLGGLAALARSSHASMALAHARLNPAQVPGAPSAAAAQWPATLRLPPAITGTAPFPVAPGIVVIPTGLPTPGSQMIFVRLASEREYLFAGDIAPLHVNFAEMRVRSHLLDRNVSNEERAAHMRWLATLQRLSHAAPDLVVLPGHDIEWVIDPKTATGVSLLAR